MIDMIKIMGKIREVQAKIKETQEELYKISTVGEAGGGLVKATVNGHKKILKIEIDEELLKEEDRQIMIDLIIAAVNKALQDIENIAKEEIKKKTQGVIPDIPGFDLSNMA